jgi:hypothetical protein
VHLPSIRGSGDLKIAAHIRRGDLLHYFKSKHEGERRNAAARSRMIPTSDYIRLLDDLLRRICRHGFAKRVVIELHSEGSKKPALVPDYVTGANSSLPSFTNFEDTARLLRWWGTSFRLGSSDPTIAMTEACESDIVITAPSSFSHLMALFCARPLFLAVPFWLSYKCIPNALALKRSEDASFNMENGLGHPVLTSRLTLPQNLDTHLVPLLLAKIKMHET